MTSNVRISTMANLKAEFHEHLTCPFIKYNKEMSIWLLESDLKMSKSHANVVSVDENVSYLSTSMNLFLSERSNFL